MKKHVLYIGLNDQLTKTQLIETQVAKEYVFATCGDCTVTESLGQYTHDNGEIVRETSLRVEMLFKTDAQVKAHAKVLKEALNQESIGFEIVECNSILI